MKHWKNQAELYAYEQVGKTRLREQPSKAERDVKRNLKLRNQMHKDFLKTWIEITEERELRPLSQPGVERPRHRFRSSKVIVHRLDNDLYPEIDKSPGISSWFKVEVFDFYHNGLRVILGIESAVIEDCLGYAGNLQWAITSYKADIDDTQFKPIKIWRLGLIPFRNIRTYDTAGDEYYDIPHLYCDFSINEMPFERFEHAVLGENGEHDWPLHAELELDETAVLKLSVSPEHSLGATE